MEPALRTSDDWGKHAPMVRRIASKLARRLPSSIGLDDLVGCGWLGLVEALARSHAGMTGDELEAFASKRVRGAMLDHVRKVAPAARVARNASRRIARATRSATERLGRAPTDVEVAGQLRLSMAELGELLGSASREGMARHDPIDIDAVELEATSAAPDELTAQNRRRSAVIAALEALPERLATVVALHYQEECTFKEIGAVLRVSESRACQLHGEAMQRLRAAIGAE